ncbi:hypothetical protein EUTSA_v10001742mg, partial [Eutrema salsugineum]
FRLTTRLRGKTGKTSTSSENFVSNRIVGKMPVMEKLRMFVAQEPVVAASCLIGGVGLFKEEWRQKLEPSSSLGYFDSWLIKKTSVSKRQCVVTFSEGCSSSCVGLFLPAVVRPILDSLEASKQVKAPPLTDVIAGVTGKKQS